MKNNQNCVVPYGHSAQETKSSKMEGYFTKLLTSLKICNAEELSKTK